MDKELYQLEPIRRVEYLLREKELKEEYNICLTFTFIIFLILSFGFLFILDIWLNLHTVNIDIGLYEAFSSGRFNQFFYLLAAVFIGDIFIAFWGSQEKKKLHNEFFNTKITVKGGKYG